MAERKEFVSGEKTLVEMRLVTDSRVGARLGEGSVCGGCEAMMEGFLKRKKMYKCGRNGVGFADMQMTSAAEGR